MDPQAADHTRSPPSVGEASPNTAIAIDAISSDGFKTWRRATTTRENIEQGRAYYNEPSPEDPPEKHTPSSLLQCHRKLAYRKSNAPRETEMAHGILWVGSQIEEEIVLPYLRDAVADCGLFVTNSLYVDFEVASNAGDLVVKGSTDPVVVDADGTPVLPTEVKTKQSIDHLRSPNEHHKAQLHAYMVGLSRKHDIDLRRGCLIYGARDSFDLKVFDVEFDDEFWENTVVAWASDHTAYRVGDGLPPADARFGWECDFCAYRERCGEGGLPVHDRGHSGFVPFVEYPRAEVTDHLAAKTDVALTPTLASLYPDLAEEHDVVRWRCTACEATFNHDQVDWGGTRTEPPLCAVCASNDRLVELTVPWPPRVNANHGGDRQ